MEQTLDISKADSFLKSLGFPKLNVHHPFNHFDFSRPGRRILVIGPMGSGKTEYSARVWRDSQIAQRKSGEAARITTTKNADRRNVFFIRSALDKRRFPDYPDDALAYRGGYIQCGNNIASIETSFELERLFDAYPEMGTWIVDEATFYDERLVYIVRNQSEQNGSVFIFPSLILNFRKDIFNPTARLLLENATDVFPLTAYCEHHQCLQDAFYTYRYYNVDGEECPALYFDPLIIIGGDKETDDPKEPNYCTRCDEHHLLPGKEYTFLFLKPLGQEAVKGNLEPLIEELRLINTQIEKSELYRYFYESYVNVLNPTPISMNALKVPCIAEKALIFLFAEQNLLSAQQVVEITNILELDREYLGQRMRDNKRIIDLF